MKEVCGAEVDSNGLKSVAVQNEVREKNDSQQISTYAYKRDVLVAFALPFCAAASAGSAG
jgi:hypothetical protein